MPCSDIKDTEAGTHQQSWTEFKKIESLNSNPSTKDLLDFFPLDARSLRSTVIAGRNVGGAGHQEIQRAQPTIEERVPKLSTGNGIHNRNQNVTH
jgi:hypothetical protein